MHKKLKQWSSSCVSCCHVVPGVSDLAHGGQVLLDSVTFAGIRDRLTELGGVDHRGYNDITVAVAARAAMKKQTAGLLCKLLRWVYKMQCASSNDTSSAFW